MTAISVAKLRLSCETRQCDRLRHRIEDGLRTTLPDERRLVLLRRMRIAGALLTASPAERDQAVRSGWLAAIAGARHGGADGAGDANCVWFESREEAEALLLARLLAGRETNAWFWKLAVPGWRGLRLEQWLPLRLDEALASGDDRGLLAMAEASIAAGAIDRLVEALGGGGHRQRQAAAEGPGGPSGPSSAPRAHPAGTPFDVARPAIALAPLPGRLERAVAILLRAGGGASAAARAIVRATALRRSPALALDPPLLAASVGAAMDRIGGGSAPRPAAGDAEAARLQPVPQPKAASAAMPTRPSARLGERAPAPVPPRLPSPPERDRQALPAAAFPVEDATEPARLPRRRHSDHAGLWLVLPSLVRLGFPEWLAARPALLGGHPASLLLHAIARHHHVGAADPVLLALPLPEGTIVLPEWTAWWRQGLDRWLRRTVRRRLHDLVMRAGEIDWDDWSVDIVYPARAVDIALRRNALDRDPGWTGWLGLSVRYHFGGEAGWL